MKAFGQIIKSLFILRYIDEVELREVIEKQLNKVELANRFTRAVAVGNPRGFEHAEKAEQEIAESCNRLIRNCIVCWNYLYMTCQLEAARTPEERDRLLRMIAIHSPQSWGHFNLLGEYDFSSEKLQDNSGALPPKTARRIIPENWEPPTRRKEQRAKGIRKSLWYFTYLGWVETDNDTYHTGTETGLFFGTCLIISVNGQVTKRFCFRPWHRFRSQKFIPKTAIARMGDPATVQTVRGMRAMRVPVRGEGRPGEQGPRSAGPTAACTRGRPAAQSKEGKPAPRGEEYHTWRPASGRSQGAAGWGCIWWKRPVQLGRRLLRGASGYTVQLSRGTWANNIADQALSQPPTF